MIYLHNVCVQANLWCTSSRARKVVTSLTLGAITTQVINAACANLAHIYIIDVIVAAVFQLLIPVAVLVINVVVAIQVRRAAIHSAANLGVQPHHQSTSAVPTIMLISTSLVYLLFQTITGITYVIWMLSRNFCIKTKIIVDRCADIVRALHQLIYAYNFFVYLTTGKLFRSDLHKLLCRCSTSSSSAPAPIPAHAHAHALGSLPPAVIAAAAADNDDNDDDDGDDGDDGDDAEVARRDVRADTAV